MTEKEALELALRFLRDAIDREVKLLLAQRLDYATHKLFQKIPERRHGHCWMFSFEYVRENAEDEIISGGSFPVVVDETTRKVLCGSDEFSEFLHASAEGGAS